MTSSSSRPNWLCRLEIDLFQEPSYWSYQTVDVQRASVAITNNILKVIFPPKSRIWILKTERAIESGFRPEIFCAWIRNSHQREWPSIVRYLIMISYHDTTSYHDIILHRWDRCTLDVIYDVMAFDVMSWHHYDLFLELTSYSISLFRCEKSKIVIADMWMQQLQVTTRNSGVSCSIFTTYSRGFPGNFNEIWTKCYWYFDRKTPIFSGCKMSR